MLAAGIVLILLGILIYLTVAPLIGLILVILGVGLVLFGVLAGHRGGV